MLIGEISALTGASARSLRHYERFGLLQTHRNDNGYRRYPAESLEVVRAIRFLLASGLTLATIAEILPAMMYQHCKLADPHVRSAIEREADRIKSKIDQLNRSYKVLTDALSKGHIRRDQRAD
jgi:DNA-binding transcriptional MerR regulator